MHLYICYPWLTRRLDGLNIFTALSRAALLGFGRRVGFSSHTFYTCLLAHLASSRWIFFTGCLFQKVWYLLLLDSQLCLIWTVSHGIRSVIEGRFYCFMFTTILDGVPKFSGEHYGQFTHNLFWNYVPIFLRFPSCCQVSLILQPLCPWGGLVGFLSIVSLYQRGYIIIGGTDPRLQAMSW